MITSRKQYPQGVPNKKPYRNTSIPDTASTLFASSKNRNQTCTFCRGQHPTEQCHVVTDIRERRNILLRQGRCYLCFRKAGHLAKDCDVSIKCFNCRGWHHVALCERNLIRFGENKNAISPCGKEEALETQSKQSEPAKEEQQNTKPAAFCGINTEAENSGKSILLQTAVVGAVNPDDQNKSVNLRVILDSGSQRTNITKNARDILRLTTVSRENVIIKVFGSDDDEINLYDLGALKLMSLNDDFEINVKRLEVPFIC